MNVHLVFHGVYAFILNRDDIEVFAPYFSAHEYLFGCWQDFEPLPKGTIKVEGIDGSNGNHPDPDFDHTQSPTVKGHPTQCCVDNLFCTFKVKYPKEVRYFRPYSRPMQAPRFPFIGVHGSGLNPNVLAGPLVFVYTADD